MNHNLLMQTLNRTIRLLRTGCAIAELSIAYVQTARLQPTPLPSAQGFLNTRAQSHAYVRLSLAQQYHTKYRYAGTCNGRRRALCTPRIVGQNDGGPNAPNNCATHITKNTFPSEPATMMMDMYVPSMA